MTKKKKVEGKKKQFVGKRSQEAWKYLIGYYAENKYMPTLREIGANAFEDTLSPEGVKYVLRAMAKEGLITLVPNKPRGILINSKTKGGE